MSEQKSAQRREQKSEQKSHIPGEGYGSTHCWLRNMGIIHDYRNVSCHYYICEVCREGFVYYYERFTEFSVSMRADGVHEVCPGPRPR